MAIETSDSYSWFKEEKTSLCAVAVLGHKLGAGCSDSISPNFANFREVQALTITPYVKVIK
jgi:hypothetical protein